MSNCVFDIENATGIVERFHFIIPKTVRSAAILAVYDTLSTKMPTWALRHAMRHAPGLLARLCKVKIERSATCSTVRCGNQVYFRKFHTTPRRLAWLRGY
jgi:hypothetical protein